MKSKVEDKTVKTIMIVLCALTLIITIIFIVKIIIAGAGFWSGDLVFETTGQAGDFIGGVIGTIFSAGAFVWAYLTLIEQQNKQSREHLENRFFELLELHRRNVEEMVFDATGRVNDPDTLCVSNHEHHGKAVFREIFKQMTTCRNELAPMFKRSSDIYEERYLEQIKNNRFVIENNITSFTQLALIDVSYCIVFYGVGAEGRAILKSLFRGKYKRSFIEQIIEYISLKPAENKEKYERWKFIEDRQDIQRRLEIAHAITRARNMQSYSGTHLSPEDDKYIKGFDGGFVKYYGGHHFRLGHYYRHLFQTIRYINEQKELTYAEKYGYVKILRAQLSSYEQELLFFNSLSQVGRKWEMDMVFNTSCEGYSVHDFELITKYNLIKNIPFGAQFGIDQKAFYPKVEYESGTSSVQRDVYK